MVSDDFLNNSFIFIAEIEYRSIYRSIFGGVVREIKFVFSVIVNCMQRNVDSIYIKDMKKYYTSLYLSTTCDFGGKEPFGRLQLNSVTVADVDKFVSKLITNETYAASSIEKIVDVDALSIEEQEQFEREARKVNDKTGEAQYSAGVYGLLLLHTGMRVGEMLALRWSDVDLENGTLNIDKNRSMAKNLDRKANEAAYIMHEGSTKNEKARKIELTPQALEDLPMIRNRHVTAGKNEFVVITQTGRPNTTTNIEHHMFTIFHNAGLTHLKGGVHILRKTFATEMYEQGARIKEIAAYIGDLESTTERYYIAIRKKRIVDGKEEHIVTLPKTK